MANGAQDAGCPRLSAARASGREQAPDCAGHRGWRVVMAGSR